MTAAILQESAARVTHKLNVATLRVGKRPANSQMFETIDIPESLTVMDGDPATPIPEHHHCFRVLTQEDGDKRIVWDCRSIRQINDAKAMFDECLKQHLVPYRVGTDGKASADIMQEFDPTAEEVIFLAADMIIGG
jgi:hypothetical protein